MKMKILEQIKRIKGKITNPKSKNKNKRKFKTHKKLKKKQLSNRVLMRRMKLRLRRDGQLEGNNFNK